MASEGDGAKPFSFFLIHVSQSPASKSDDPTSRIFLAVDTHPEAQVDSSAMAVMCYFMIPCARADSPA